MLLSAAQLHETLLRDLSVYIDVSAPKWNVDASSSEVACYLLRDSFTKKWLPGDRQTSAQEAVALEKFERVNQRLSGWVYAPNTSADEELVGAVRRRMYQFWERYDPALDCCVGLVHDLRQLFERGKAGPGASVKARGEDLYTKMFDSPLSATRRLADVWPKLLPPGAFCDAESVRRATYGAELVVDESKLAFVPKNDTTARTIAVEPSVNMWLQLGLGAVISDRLSATWGIDITTQQGVQRELAYRGSRTGGLSTIDLSSASDSIGSRMLGLICPPDFLRWLKLLRCDSIRLPDGRSLELHMISTMGNGYTFALETVLFASVVLGVYDYLDIRPVFAKTLRNGDRVPGNFGVYGDDIICVASATRLVIRVLHLLGFELNNEKTFVEGPFRESCGGDYYCGYNVRPVQIKRTNSYEDLFVAINRLNTWTARHGVSLRRTVELLLSRIKRPERFFVPRDCNDDVGIKVPAKYAMLGTSVCRKGDLLHYSIRRPKDKLLLFSGGVVWRLDRDMKPRLYNSAAHLVCAVGGYLVSMSERHIAQGISTVRYLCDTVTLRQRSTVYCTKREATPVWDRISPHKDPGLGLGLAVEVWAAETNMVSMLVFGTGP